MGHLDQPLEGPGVLVPQGVGPGEALLVEYLHPGEALAYLGEELAALVGVPRLVELAQVLNDRLDDQRLVDAARADQAPATTEMDTINFTERAMPVLVKDIINNNFACHVMKTAYRHSKNGYLYSGRLGFHLFCIG